jgi:hypothetical protein
MRRTAAGVLVTAVLTLATTGTAHAADVYNCDDFTYQEEAQAVYDQDTSDPNGLDDNDDDVACESLPRRGSAAAPTAGTGTSSGNTGTSGSSNSQVTTRPAGAVAAGDGSASEDGSVLPFVLGGAALAAAGGAAVAARRSARASA